VWARLAERLAKAGVASIRFDYLGLHDSTGDIERVSLSQVTADQMVAAARFAQGAAQVRPIVAAGNCLGAQAALFLAAEMEECVGTICLLPRITEPGRITVAFQTAAGGRAVAFVRRHPWLRRAGRAVARRNLKTRSYLLESVSKATQHGKVLFLIDEPFRLRMHSPTKLEEALETIQEDMRHRFELRMLPGTDLDRFGSLHTHEVVLDTLTNWIDERLEDGRLLVTPRLRPSSTRH
jgi:dienelactone hydrolase